MKKRFIFDLDGTLLNGDFSKEINYFKNVLGKEANKFLSVCQKVSKGTVLFDNHLQFFVKKQKGFQEEPFLLTIVKTHYFVVQ